MVIYFKGRTQGGVFQFGEFFVSNHDKTIIGKNIFDFSFDQYGSAHQAGVVQSENRYRLVEAVMEFDQSYAGI